jgi:hypothetical protein
VARRPGHARDGDETHAARLSFEQLSRLQRQSRENPMSDPQLYDSAERILRWCSALACTGFVLSVAVVIFMLVK